MFRIWFERTLPTQYSSLIDGLALVAGAADQTPDTPFLALHDAHAVIASGRIRYDRSFMDRAPHLRVISRTGIGVDNVSVPEATKRGIAVCNAPDGPTISTAEHAVAMMLSVAKRLKHLDQVLLRGGKRDFFNEYDGLELHGRTLGLIGLGRIGSHVASVGKALGMVVVAFDPYVTAERVRSLNIELIPSLDALLLRTDILSLHLPLTEETRHLMDATRLARLKRGAILINTARGGLVDEAALLQALESGHLSGAGLDALEKEPPASDYPLLRRHDVVITPHIAAATGASKDRLWQTAIRQALQVLQRERPAHLVNPEVCKTA